MATEPTDRMIALLEGIHDLSRKDAEAIDSIRDAVAKDPGTEAPSIIAETPPLGAEIAERLRRVDEAAQQAGRPTRPKPSSLS